MKKERQNRYALLDHDVRDAFPDDESVNEALRVILTAAQTLALRLSLRTKQKKRRDQNYEEKMNCRVLAMSGKRGLFATPIRGRALICERELSAINNGCYKTKTPSSRI